MTEEKKDADGTSDHSQTESFSRAILPRSESFSSVIPAGGAMLALGTRCASFDGLNLQILLVEGFGSTGGIGVAMP